MNDKIPFPDIKNGIDEIIKLCDDIEPLNPIKEIEPFYTPEQAVKNAQRKTLIGLDINKNYRRTK